MNYWLLSSQLYVLCTELNVKAWHEWKPVGIVLHLTRRCKSSLFLGCLYNLGAINGLFQTTHCMCGLESQGHPWGINSKLHWVSNNTWNPEKFNKMDQSQFKSLITPELFVRLRVWENSLNLLPLCCPDNLSLILEVQSRITMSAPPTISALSKKRQDYWNYKNEHRFHALNLCKTHYASYSFIGRGDYTSHFPRLVAGRF